jgi:hypothetical protein
MSRTIVRGRLAFVDAADPGAGQIRQRLQVGVGRQPLGLEAPHLAARGGGTIEPVTANDRPHRGVAGEPLGVIDILVAGESTEHRLAEQPLSLWRVFLPRRPSSSFVIAMSVSSTGVIQLAVSEQTAGGGDLGAVVLRVLALVIPLIILNDALAAQWLIPHGLTIAAAAVLAIGLALPIVPTYEALGMAWVTVVVELFILAGLACHRHRIFVERAPAPAGRRLVASPRRS